MVYLCTVKSLTSDQQMALQNGALLPLMEAFYTLQGEGYHTGTSAYFLRLGGCDVGCHWCDVKESWDAALHPATPTAQMVQAVPEVAQTAVITGGEPLLWKLDLLTQLLHERGIQCHIETSGAYPLSGSWDWFCLSPKKTRLPVEDAYNTAHELKVIIHNQHDLIFAEEQAQRVGKHCILFLQPEWSKRDKITPLLIEYVMQNPKWRLSLQTHKYLNIP